MRLWTFEVGGFTISVSGFGVMMMIVSCIEYGYLYTVFRFLVLAFEKKLKSRLWLFKKQTSGNYPFNRAIEDWILEEWLFRQDADLRNHQK